MANELQRHKTLDRVKWFVTLIVGLALIACVIALFVKLDRQTTTTTIGGEAYSIGTIDETGEYAEGDTAIYLRNGITTDGKNYAWSRQTDITEAFDIERGEDYFVLKFPEEFSIEGVLETLYPDAEIEAGILSDKARYYTLVVSSYNGEEVCEIDFSVRYPYEIRVQTEKDGPIQGEPTVDVPEYAQAGERIEFTVDFQGITSPYTLTGVGIQPFSSGEVQMLTEEDGKYSFVMPEDNVRIIVYLEYIV